MVDQNSESFLGFLGLTIWSLSLGIDDDFLCCHSLSRLLHKLLLEATHLVVELHVLISSYKHLLSHYLLLLVWESLAGCLCIKELVLEPRLTSKWRLKHRWINKNWCSLHQHSLRVSLSILIELSLCILVKAWILDVLHLIRIHVGWGHHLLLLVVHILRHIHFLFSSILIKLLRAALLQLLASMGERASGTIRTVSAPFVKFALHSLIIVSTILEVALEVLSTLAHKGILLEHHSIVTIASTVASRHILLHASLIPLVELLALEVATTTSSLIARHILLETTTHVVSLLILATHVLSTLWPLGVVIDRHPSHSSSLHMLRNWLNKIN